MTSHADWLRPLLRCPNCKGELHDAAHDQLVCPACQVAYPVHDGVPGLLSHRAVPHVGYS